MTCPNCGKLIPDNSSVCPECLRPIQNTPIPPEPVLAEPAQSMKWYKFLIFFALWANAILNIIGGVSQLTGTVYSVTGIPASDIYAYYGQGLHVLDIVMGVVMIAIAVFSIIVRFQLAGYKKQGPKMLLVLYAVNLVVSLAYSLAVSAITSINVMDSSSVGGLVISAVMIVVNYIYFKKRAHLFCN